MERATPPDAAAERAPPPRSRGDVCAVVVHYRCEADVIACVESLARHASGMPVVVVENGSDDGSAARLAQALAAHPQARLVAAAENRGFGAGCNFGIEEALSAFQRLRHVLLVNPDARAQARLVEELVATADRRPAAGIVGGRVLALDGERVLFENGRFRPWTLGSSHAPAPRGQAEFRTEFVTGALMLIDADLLRNGLRFDERYFLYVEDLDLCREVVARGRELWINVRATVLHREGGSQRDERATAAGMRPAQLRWITRNKAYFARKRLPPAQRAVFFAVAFVAKPVAALAQFRGTSFLRTYFTALVEEIRVPLR